MDRRVVRAGATVRRPTGPWTPAVHGLLNHLQNGAFEHVPRVVGTDGEFETVTFIAGTPRKWFRGLDQQPGSSERLGQITFYATFDLESSLRRLGNGDWVGNEDPAGFTPYRRGPRR